MKNRFQSLGKVILVILIFILGQDANAQTQRGQDIDGENAGDLSGWSVSMPDANTVAIGAPNISGNGSESGHVRVFSWDGSNWTQKGVDISGENADDRSGWSVSMPDANTAAIGAYHNDGNGNYSGHVRIYSWDGGSWIQKGLDIDGEAPYDQSGWSVSMPDANTVAIGAPNNGGNGSESGHVRIYSWNGTSWTQKGLDIDGEAPNDQSGCSVSMPDSNTVAIGAQWNSTAVGSISNGLIACGHVRIYSWNGTSWTQKGADIDGEADWDMSGNSVSMPDANTVAIGAPYNNGNGNRPGHVRIYSWNGTSWIQKGLDIDGENAADFSGCSVSMPDANTVAIGAHHNEGNGYSSGHVRIYFWDGSNWAQKGVDIDGENVHDESGISVSMPDANTVAIGAHLNDGNGSESGHVRIFDDCAYPSNIQVGNFTTNSVDILWSSNATQHAIEYGSVGFSPGSGTILLDTTSSFTIAGLTASTFYDFYIIDSCSTSRFSISGPFQFRTPCAPTNHIISTLDSLVVCEGESIVLKGPQGLYSYLWSDGTTLDSMVISSVGNQNNYVVITDQNGCSDTSQILTTTINPVNTATVTTSHPNNTICEGDTITLRAPLGDYLETYFNSDNGIAVNNNGFSGNAFEILPTSTVSITGFDINVSTLNSITVRVEYLLNSIASSQVATVGAPWIVHEILTVNGAGQDNPTNVPLSIPLVLPGGQVSGIRITTSLGMRYTNGTGGNGAQTGTPITTNSKMTIYEGYGVRLSDGSVYQPRVWNGRIYYENNSLSYLWSNGSTGQSISFTQSDSVSLKVTNSYGCVDSSSYQYVTVNSNPVSSLVVLGDSIVCEGESIVLKGAQGPYSYLWSDGTTLDSMVITSVGNQNNYVVVTDQNGCSDTSQILTTIINPIDNAIVSTNHPNNTICEGDTVILEAPQGSGLSYLWSNGSTSQSISLTQSDSVNLQVTNSYGCTDSSSYQYVTVNSNPLSSLVVLGDSIVCEGESIVLKGPQGPYSYLWSDGTTLDSLIVDSVGNQNNYLVITDQNGCSDTSSVQATTVNPLPSIQIGISGSSKVCFGDSILLVPTLTSLVDSIAWFNSASLYISNNDSLYSASSGTYYAKVYSVKGCSNTSNSQNISITPIDVNINSVNASCATSSDGVISLGLSGSHPPYSVLWNNGNSSQSLVGISPSSNYTALITDSLGCIKTINASVGYNHLNQQAIISGADAPLCFGENDTLYLNNAYNSILWGGQASGNSDSVIVGPGTTFVSMIDTNNCPSADTVTIKSDAPYTTNPEICMVTVDNTTGKNKIVWERTSKEGVELYNIYRQDLLGFTIIGSQGVNQLSEFTDLSSTPNSKSFKYYITLVDSCGIEHGDGNNYHETIHLQANQGTLNEVNLGWNQYVGTSLLYWVIYRKNPGANNFSAIDSVNISTTSYTDFNAPSGLTEYQVAGVLPNPCNSSNKTNSRLRSNVIQEQTIGIIENVEDFLRIYPNPTTGIVQIEPLNNHKIESIIITNEIGKTWEIKPTQNQLDLRDMPAGMYFLDISLLSGDLIKTKLSLVK